MIVWCPWCGDRSDCAGWSERPEGVAFEVVCDGCGRAFWVSYEMRPEFTVELPREMRVCYDDWSDEGMCQYWDIEGMCQFERTPPCRRECEVNRGCPLGHGRGEREEGR